jgi:DNA-binding response OmpR family regulator
MEDVLKGKRILIVDDEPDILETLAEILDMCFIDTAPDFETAQKFLRKNEYDLAILDIMGVRGYDLLELANERDIPALMLTAHAVSPDNLVRSIKGGARSYVPKDKISDIPLYIRDILEVREKGGTEKGAK